MPQGLFSGSRSSLFRWRDYTLAAAASVAKNDTVIVCAVSQPCLLFLNNWLTSIARKKHQEKVLVIAEDYATLYKVNERWPGHAVLALPAPDAQTAHKFGSQVDLYLLQQAAFPTGGLLLQESDMGSGNQMNACYIMGFDKKIKRFHDYDLWLVDDHAKESPLGRL